MPDREHRGRDQFSHEMQPFVRAARIVSVAWALVAASAASAVVALAFHVAALDTSVVRSLAAASFVLIVLATTATWRRRWTLLRVASDLEWRAGGLDNLIVTAAEAIESPRRPLHPVVADAVWTAARERLVAATPHASAVIGPVAAALLCMVAAAVAVWSLPEAKRFGDEAASLEPASASSDLLRLGDVRVHITPPPYTGRSPSEVVNPQAITVLEGSRVRIDVTGTEGVQLIEPSHAPIDLIRSGDVWTHTLTPTASRVLLLQPRSTGEPRLLHVRVDPDRRPTVRIQAPARDLVVPDARSRVPVAIVAEDDLALANLRLRYTRIAGSGETFTFEEGDLPLAIRRDSESKWQARATLRLDGLELEDGDTLVYRALVRDGVPDREPSASETYIIDVGRLGGVAATGFAVPEERDRQALSQQMVIIKTERLHAARATLGPDALLEQSRLLAVEQRMVRAEFVFMTGGHVEDEVAEAEAGHEIVEGRLENEAQVELLNAIREMSRAEARLNDGDTAAALTFERAALRALQRAFDRRRYLLRTLPERTRIDPSRRLTGERREARGAALSAATPPPDPVVSAARAMMAELAAMSPAAPVALVAARVAAVDPANPALQEMAVRMAAAAEPDARRAASEEAQRLLGALLQSRLGAPPRGRLLADPLAGRVADALQRGQR